MPTTSAPGIRTIADIVQTALKCSSKDANAAEKQICSSPSNVAKLAAACGVSQMTAGFGGILTVAGLVPSAQGLLLPGLAIGGIGAMGIKRFCRAMVDKGTAAISAE